MCITDHFTMQEKLPEHQKKRNDILSFFSCSQKNQENVHFLKSKVRSYKILFLRECIHFFHPLSIYTSVQEVFAEACLCVYESHSVVSDSLCPHVLYSPWNSPGQNTGVDSLSLLQRIFLSQRLNPGLLHCGQIIYQLNHKGSPTMSQIQF